MHAKEKETDLCSPPSRRDMRFKNKKNAQFNSALDNCLRKLKLGNVIRFWIKVLGQFSNEVVKMNDI